MEGHPDTSRPVYFPILSTPLLPHGGRGGVDFFIFFITLGLELSDTKVYEPSIRALLELLRNTAEQLFSNRELYRSPKHSTLNPLSGEQGAWSLTVPGALLSR